MLYEKPYFDDMQRIHLHILLILCLFCAYNSHSTDLADLGQSLNIQPVWVLKDELQSLNANTVLEIDKARWRLHNDSQLNLGYTPADIWLKFEISNSHNDTISSLVVLTFPLLDHLSIYKLQDGHLHLEMQSGDNDTFDSRIIEHPLFILPIAQEAQTSTTYFIKITSTTSIQTQIQLWEENAFHAKSREDTALNFFYYGLLVSTALFNLFVFLFIRQPIFLNYAIYAITFVLFIAAQRATLFEYFLFNHPSIHNWSQLVFASLTTTFALIFTRNFLEFTEKDKYNTLLKRLALIPIPLLCLSSLSGEAFAIQTSLASIIIVTTICYVISIIEWINKRPNAAIFVIAWSFLYLGGIIYTLGKIGVLPFNSFTSNAIQYGSVLELLTFAAALAHNMHSEREARLSAQKTILEKTQANSELQDKIIYSSTHNKTSGLPNRVMMESWLDKHLRTHPSEPCTLVFIYFSRLHEIGRTLGKETSDLALKAFSERLNNLARSVTHVVAVQKESDFYVGSMEGATHALLLEAATDNKLISEVSALQRTLNKPFNINSIAIEPGVQVALVESPEHGTQASQLIRHGSIALDAARENKLQLSQYKPDIDPYSERRLELMSELRKALQHNELMLHYQPIVDVKTQEIQGAEALIRWPHPSHGLIMPDEFISIAEQTGLIHDLSIWVLNQALTPLKNWIKNHPDFLLSINISASNLQERHFIQSVTKTLSNNPELSERLILELTESQMMKETKFALENLWSLSELGVQIAIDDFGTGYSSLSYLRKLPAQKLKIDKSFILNLETDKQNQVLVQTAIDMAHNLGLKVVAEGVESEHTRAILSKMDCDLCQGFHFSRPVPLEQFNKLLLKPIQ